MKILKLGLFVFFVSIIFIRCERNKQELLIEKTPKWSKAVALKNGQSWKSYALAWVNKKNPGIVTILTDVYNDFGYLRESLYFIELPYKTGHYILRKKNYNIDTLKTYSFYATSCDDGDVSEDYFDLVEEENNFVEIKTIDPANMIMSGTFQATFVRDTSDFVTNPSLPDTFRFEKGYFYMKIVEKD